MIKPYSVVAKKCGVYTKKFIQIFPIGHKTVVFIMWETELYVFQGHIRFGKLMNDKDDCFFIVYFAAIK